MFPGEGEGGANASDSPPPGSDMTSPGQANPGTKSGYARINLSHEADLHPDPTPAGKPKHRSEGKINKQNNVRKPRSVIAALAAITMTTALVSDAILFDRQPHSSREVGNGPMAYPTPRESLNRATTAPRAVLPRTAPPGPSQPSALRDRATKSVPPVSLDFPITLPLSPTLGSNASAASQYGSPPRLQVDLGARKPLEPRDLSSNPDKNTMVNIVEGTKVKLPKLTITSGASKTRSREMAPVYAVIPKEWRKDSLNSTTTYSYGTIGQGVTYKNDLLPPGTPTGQFLKASDGTIVGINKVAKDGRFRLNLSVTGDGRGGVAKRGATLTWTGKVRCEVVQSHPDFAYSPGDACTPTQSEETITWTWSANGSGAG